MELLLIAIIIFLLFVILKLNFFKQIYTHSTNGISIIEDGKIVDCNDRLLKLFEYDSKKEFLQEHPLKLSPPFQPDGSFSFDKENRMMLIAKEEGSCRFDWVFLTKKAQEKNIEIDIIKVKTFLKKEKYFMSWRDIDKRIEAEEKLKLLNEDLEQIIEKKIKKNKQQEQILLQQSKQAQMGEMLSMIAHQWRQPLGAISSSVIDIQMKILFNDFNTKKLLEYITNELQNIEKFTQVLTTTIDNFRDFYKFSKNKEKILISSPINKACQIVDKSFQENQIKLEVVSEKDLFIPMLEGEIIQVLLSILQNAKENFIQKDIKNKKVTISTAEDLEYGILTICDNGKGIDNGKIDKIFLPYFTTKESKNGTGLGLYMAQKIVREHHGGNIEVKNSKEGICFNIYLRKDEN